MCHAFIIDSVVIDDRARHRCNLFSTDAGFDRCLNAPPVICRSVADRTKVFYRPLISAVVNER